MSRTYDQLRSISSRDTALAIPSPDTTLAEPLNMRPLYFSTRRTARVLGCAFVIAAAVAWLAAGYELGELRWFAQAEGAALDAAAKLAHAAAGWWIAIAQIACSALVAALFIPWLHQARANLRALGIRRLRFGREWTYLAFAIPVLNAYRPYQVVSEVWRGSDPASTDPLGWQRLATSRLVLAWWVGLVAWVVFELLSALLLRIAPGIQHVEIAHALGFAGDVGAAASASLGYFLAARIAAAQDAKWAALGLGDHALLHPETARACPSAFGARV
jgi:hypothetical protein